MHVPYTHTHTTHTCTYTCMYTKHTYVVVHTTVTHTLLLVVLLETLFPVCFRAIVEKHTYIHTAGNHSHAYVMEPNFAKNSLIYPVPLQ